MCFLPFSASSKAAILFLGLCFLLNPIPEINGQVQVRLIALGGYDTVNWLPIQLLKSFLQTLLSTFCYPRGFSFYQCSLSWIFLNWVMASSYNKPIAKPVLRR